MTTTFGGRSQHQRGVLAAFSSRVLCLAFLLSAGKFFFHDVGINVIGAWKSKIRGVSVVIAANQQLGCREVARQHDKPSALLDSMINVLCIYIYIYIHTYVYYYSKVFILASFINRPFFHQ